MYLQDAPLPNNARHFGPLSGQLNYSIRTAAGVEAHWRERIY